MHKKSAINNASEDSIIFHGEIINKNKARSHKFSVGTRFHFSNASYNDDFTVVAEKKDLGADYRQLVGKLSGEVWMMLSSLQGEAALGAITFEDNENININRGNSNKIKNINKSSKKKVNKKKVAKTKKAKKGK